MVDSRKIVLIFTSIRKRETETDVEATHCLYQNNLFNAVNIFLAQVNNSRLIIQL